MAPSVRQSNQPGVYWHRLVQEAKPDVLFAPLFGLENVLERYAPSVWPVVPGRETRQEPP